MTRRTPRTSHAPPPPARPPAPRIARRLDGRGPDRAGLVRLGELEGVALADGAPDIRGWTVRSAEGRAIGRVDDLLVDTDRMRVRYVAVALDESQMRGDGDHRLLTPVDTARLDLDGREVLLARSVADIADVAHRERGRPPR